MPNSPILTSVRRDAWRLRGTRGRDGQTLTLEPFEGQPVVLAFIESWLPRDSGAVTLEALRAELRGLGAVLVALTRDALWCFRPDDEMQVFARRDEIDARDVLALRERLGMREGRGSPGEGDPARTLGLFVVDGDHKVRFAHVAAVPGADASAATLLEALSAAGRALSAPRPASVLISRRELVVASLVAGFALVLLEGCRARAPSPGPTDGPSALASAGPPGSVAGELDVTLNVNGVPRTVRIDPRVSLLDALRERMALTGTKKGCDHGQCGACTLLVDGRRVNSCLTLAVMVQGAKVTTIEGLARGAELHPMQAAFAAEDALQCGYCTPGQIMSAVGLVAEGHAATNDAIREGMSGNLCRCGAYPNIVAAIRRSQGAPSGPIKVPT
jgi:xanthine dehydrogenase YagT iron-sulfur-binding subunit